MLTGSSPRQAKRGKSSHLKVFRNDYAAGRSTQNNSLNVSFPLKTHHSSGFLGKAAPVEISESDSDFATPTQTQPKRGKRKLHKSQISTPELIPPPDRPGLKDVVPETPDTETKLTRSRTRLIQQHLSGHSLRKTRSRNTKL